MALTLEVDLSDRLSHLATGDEIRDSLATKVQESAARVAATLGLPVDVSAVVTTSGGTAPVALRVDGVRGRFPDLLPALAHSALRGTWPEPADPDAWIASADSAHTQAEVVSAVCEQALVLDPSLLVSEEAAAAFSARLVAHDPALASSLGSSESTRTILRAVAGLRISVADTERIASLLRDGEGSSPDQLAELLIGGLAADTVGILAPPTIGRSLGRGDSEDPDDLLGYVAEGLTEETGVVTPRLVVEPDQGLPADTFAIRINDLVTLPTRLLPEGTVLVNEVADRLPVGTEVVASTVNPATGQPAALVVAAAGDLEAMGYTTWTTTQHVCLQLAAELRRHAAALVSQDRLLAQLDVLEEYYPLLVRSARAELPPARLTRLVRGLARDHVPLRHLPLLLERVVDLPAAMLGAQRYALLSDPVPTPAPDGTAANDPHSAETFLRTGLRYEVARQVSRGEVVVVYLLAPELEALVVEQNRSEADDDRLLAAIDAELSHLPPTALRPALLTTSHARAPLSELVRSRFPTMVVLAHEDLPPEAALQPVARIASLD